MANQLARRDEWVFPRVTLPSIWEDFLEGTRLDAIPSGLSVSEDEKNFYVDASMPGLDPKDIEVTFDRGILMINGEKEEEEREKKFYRKATNQFSYSIVAPENIDSKAEPKLVYKNGVMHAVFEKTAASKPKKIAVKAE
ncbi:MAG: Hsp20 family protein [Candidatus Daviesbacteria bacterium]|nr:Hsp20 family protein [Candidatus Daviesbacteria bacterium]